MDSAFVSDNPDMQAVYDALTDEKKEIADRVAQLCELEGLLNQLIGELPNCFARDQAAAKTFEAFAWMCGAVRVAA